MLFKIKKVKRIESFYLIPPDLFGAAFPADCSNQNSIPNVSMRVKSDFDHLLISTSCCCQKNANGVAVGFPSNTCLLFFGSL